MAIFGLLLILLGVGLGVTSLVALGYDTEVERQVAMLGITITPQTVFVLGAVTAVLILMGLWFMKSGTQRAMARRKELKRVHERNAQLEAERRKAQSAESSAADGHDDTTTNPKAPPKHQA